MTEDAKCSPASAPTYEDGLRDGQLKAIEATQAHHGQRLDNHGKRLRILERIVWGVCGVAIFLEVWPTLRGLFGAPPQ